MITDSQRRKNQELKAKLREKREAEAKKRKGAVCELHHLRLVEGRVRLRFGEPSLSDAYLDARINMFPNSKLILFGGCSPPIIDEQTGEADIETKATLHYCPRCREIEEAWLESHAAYRT
ncbi:MAG: hypothetical protein SWE60_15855 [Thermodesulfobacteriota bacterium]|nr:hypothetical protein [Thermodesulfobacteriota bacterium]